MRAGERETICHCWVILRSREQGLLSLFETHTRIHVLSLLVPDTLILTHTFTNLYTLRQHSWRKGQRLQNIQVNSKSLTQELQILINMWCLCTNLKR